MTPRIRLELYFWKVVINSQPCFSGKLTLWHYKLLLLINAAFTKWQKVTAIIKKCSQPFVSCLPLASYHHRLKYTWHDTSMIHKRTHSHKYTDCATLSQACAKKKRKKKHFVLWYHMFEWCIIIRFLVTAPSQTMSSLTSDKSKTHTLCVLALPWSHFPITIKHCNPGLAQSVHTLRCTVHTPATGSGTIPESPLSDLAVWVFTHSGMRTRLTQPFLKCWHDFLQPVKHMTEALKQLPNRNHAPLHQCTRPYI